MQTSAHAAAEQPVPPLKKALSRARQGFFSAGVFSFAINLLMLTGPLFMLQVYDRVLTSRSVPTLVALYALVVSLFAFLGFFQFLRTRVLSRIGYRVDTDLMRLAEKVRIFHGLVRGSEEVRPVADLARIRQFIASPALAALFDLPWVPVYFAIVFFMHPWLGWLTLGGIAIITLFTAVDEFLIKKNVSEANYWELESARVSEISHRNADAIVSMGMLGNILNYWQRLHVNAMSHAQKANNVSETTSSASKAIRLLLQSSILALGAYLAIHQLTTPGIMVAASIIGGRALAPIDQIVGGWRNFVGARQAYKRLDKALAGTGQTVETIELPEPQGNLTVSNVTKFAPKGGAEETGTILQGVHFALKPGDAVGVIGPSASGKSSLAKLLTGLWLPDRGSVRLDGATFDQWDRDVLGRHIGYLPQTVELMRGTIKDNIARFDPEARDEDVIAAARLADVNDLILSFPGGYSARVGDGKLFLSGGQVQRIALARAVYGNPALIILDEPNSNLDAEGDAALARAIDALRKAKRTVVVMAHRPSAIASVNLLLMLRNGQQADFGPKEEVLKRVTMAANNIASTPIGVPA